MATTPRSADLNAPAGAGDAFGVLDECHRRTLRALEQLETVVERVEGGSADGQTRALAAEVVQHFSTTARQHHEDEERHVFPALTASADAAMRQAILRLQEDHHWLEEDWIELQPHIDAIACGQSWYDVAVLREGAAIFAALSRDHIELEETCLYPAARARLRPSEELAMEREMTARRRAARRSAASARLRTSP